VTRALAGIRVIECGHFIAGPRTSQLLADQGADVVKVEPLTGDPSRRADPLWHGHSLYFFSHNRGKRSLAVNLKHPEGMAVFRRLVERADAFITNFSPEAIEKLGVGHASLAAINPRIISVQISAYGLGSGMGGPGGVDGTIQSISGLADMIGEADGPPTVTSIPVIDHLTAVDAAYALMLALRERDLTGVGQLVDVALYDVAMSILAYAYSDVLQRGGSPRRDGSRAPYAFTTTYRSSDGYVFIAPMINEMWVTLSRIVGHPEWGEPGADYLSSEVRLRDRKKLEPEIEAWTSQRTRADIVETLGAAGVVCAPVNRIDEAISSPLTAARGMVRWVNAGGSGGEQVAVPGEELKFAAHTGEDTATATVPALGADAATVLCDIGYAAAEVDQLRASGVVL
jgi:crotonobetainyl-CoA:carnitine CoA-transferase CaiB-like acyl-CoA transferase